MRGVRVSFRNYNDFGSLFFATMDGFLMSCYIISYFIVFFLRSARIFIVVHAEFWKVEIEFKVFKSREKPL